VTQPADSGPHSPPSSFRQTTLLVLIVTVAAALRIWGIGFGLPHREARPDESVAFQIAMNVLDEDPNPHFFHWPTLYMYVMAGVFAAWHLVSEAIGRHRTGQDLLIEWGTNPAALFVLGRLVSAAAGTFTVVLVHRIGRRVADEATALAAAAAMAVVFLNVRDSHFGMLDVPMSMFVCGAVLCVVERRIALAGLFAGLAASTKYNAVIVCVPVLVGEVIAVMDARVRSTAVGQAAARMAMFAVVFTLTFVAGTPYAVLDWPKFSFDLVDQIHHMAAPHAGIDAGLGWARHPLVNLRYGMGLPLFAASLAGMVVWMRAGWRRAAIVSSFPLAYYVAAGSSHTVFARYMNPVVPFLCLTAAWLVVWIGRRVSESFPRGRPAAVTIVLLLAVLLPSLGSSIAFDRLIGRTDTRVLAADWLRQRVTAADSVYRNGYLDGQPALYFAHQEWTFDAVRSHWLTPDHGSEEPPTWIVVQESALRAYSELPAQIRPLLERRYDLVQTFFAANARDRRHVYDVQDAFYVPLAGFSGVERPGPNIYVYRLK
jgi:4-amino-4-deoxy-L-arabinose transferase-like glycosyltransferase